METKVSRDKVLSFLDSKRFGVADPISENDSYALLFDNEGHLVLDLAVSTSNITHGEFNALTPNGKAGYKLLPNGEIWQRKSEYVVCKVRNTKTNKVRDLAFGTLTSYGTCNSSEALAKVKATNPLSFKGEGREVLDAVESLGPVTLVCRDRIPYKNRGYNFNLTTFEVENEKKEAE